MRRAIIATAGTVVALVAILDYKSSGALKAGTALVPAATSTSSPSAIPVSSSSSSPTTVPPSTVPPPTVSSTTGQFTGSVVSYQYGEIEARVTIRSGKIVAIAFPIQSAPDPRSDMINAQAIPALTREVLVAQSLHIDVVSGATYTSDAFAQTLQAALSRAGR